MQKLLKVWKLLTSPEMLSYIFFGICTTLVNLSVYWLLNSFLKLSWEISNVSAWVISVAFAFITNKLFVFKSTDKSQSKVIFEMLSFVGSRLFSLAADMGCMYIMLDVLGTPSMLAKVISNVIVIIINYILSKFIVFKKN